MAGSGKTGEPLIATSLPQVRQKLAVNTPTHNGNTAVIPATLAAAAAEEDYTLTELGVYASDPDKGEILYKVYKLSAPVAIAAGSQMVLRFYLEETVSQDVDITVVCSPAGLITEEDFAPARATAAASENIQLEASKTAGIFGPFAPAADKAGQNYCQRHAEYDAVHQRLLWLRGARHSWNRRLYGEQSDPDMRLQGSRRTV